jgi:hypothetical protein
VPLPACALTARFCELVALSIGGTHCSSPLTGGTHQSVPLRPPFASGSLLTHAATTVPPVVLVRLAHAQAPRCADPPFSSSAPVRQSTRAALSQSTSPDIRPPPSSPTSVPHSMWAAQSSPAQPLLPKRQRQRLSKLVDLISTSD